MAPFLVFWGGSTAFSYCRDRNYGAAPRTLRPTRTVVDVGACGGEVKCLSASRCHHLLKTFWCGVDGWREQQLPDGTLIVTVPTGHTYTTKPGDEPSVPPSDGRGLMMPKRRRTRAVNLARRIQAERKLNDDHIAERNKPPPF